VIKLRSLFSRSLKNDVHGIMDITVVIAVGVVFAALMVVAYVIFTLQDSLVPDTPSSTTSALYNRSYYSIKNITGGFDDAVNLILVAITVFILAIAIAALLMLRGRQ